ncbi:flagellar hook-associated protein FlgL [Massilia sp. LXY-6]|uniref:flagellar hook-associated protein FlgL n=1 Tax=Massilia sp. LXY-6 TaxID=3379823 RepID=UPI003EE3E0AC
MTLRISTSAIFAIGTTKLNTLQAQMAKTQMQLSSNTRVLTAADDPIASARALEVTQSQSMNTQFGTNRANAKSSLSLVENALDDATGLLQDVQTLTVQAGNGTLSDSERGMLATELEARMVDLLGVANTADGTGAYLFSGYQTNTKPFVQTSTGATYQGDQGQRSLKVGSTRNMAMSETGSNIFDNIPTGNGTFQVNARGTNQGNVVSTTAAVTDSTQLTGHNYTVKFQVTGTPAVTTYTVTDAATNTARAAGTYTGGQQIDFDGMSIKMDGAPADGDALDVQPSPKQSLFTTITNLVGALRVPTGTSAGKALMSNGVAAASTNLSQALDNILTVRASVGSRLKELDYLDSSGDNLNIQYQSTLSDMKDLDMTKAISLFTQQQQTLQAAQMSFKTMSGLSLFNYIT